MTVDPSAASSASVDFSGGWKLRTSDGLDAYLKEEGWGIIMRKAANLANAHQTIVQDDTSLTIKIKNTKGEYTYTVLTDGTEATYIDNDKDEVKTSGKFSEDGQQFIETMTKGTAQKKYCTTRYMEGGEMKLKITNVAGKFCVRIFKKDT